MLCMSLLDTKDDQIHLRVCNAMYAKHVKDRSNTRKGCNVMYVGVCRKMEKKHTHTFWLKTPLNSIIFNQKKVLEAET